jgi:hypothetical protein
MMGVGRPRGSIHRSVGLRARPAPMTAIIAASVAESRDTANPFPDLPAIREPDAGTLQARPATRCFPSPRFGDYSRTRFESRVAIGGPDEDAEDAVIAIPTRQFSMLEVTSNLPDDSREADVRASERRLRELRGCVKAARAVVSTTPGLADTLALDWEMAARFYARSGITEAQFRQGVLASPAEDSDASEDLRL